MLTLAPEGVRMLRSRAGAAIWSYGSQWTLRPCLRANKTKPCGEGVCELVLQAAGQKGVRAQGLGHAWGARGAWLNPSTSTHEFALFSAGSKVHLSLLLLLFFFFLPLLEAPVPPEGLSRELEFTHLSPKAHVFVQTNTHSWSGGGTKVVTNPPPLSSLLSA